MKVSIEDSIREKFTCVKCKHEYCMTKKGAMTGTGFSKMFDVQHTEFLFVSCMNCGYVEVFDPEILEGKRKELSTFLDIFFGG
ncbi:zinc ribbon domain-containing protein [Pseudalkalibacillus sp. SCS-8]|uniref:zinc ribbon domain-containing protein n=1 Tax=Pseudalkalibacillus nanhaiensis TaxID=3115291 RepID=UPI0032D9F7AA